MACMLLKVSLGAVFFKQEPVLLQEWDGRIAAAL